MPDIKEACFFIAPVFIMVLNIGKNLYNLYKLSNWTYNHLSDTLNLVFARLVTMGE